MSGGLSGRVDPKAPVAAEPSERHRPMSGHHVPDASRGRVRRLAATVLVCSGVVGLLLTASVGLAPRVSALVRSETLGARPPAAAPAPNVTLQLSDCFPVNGPNAGGVGYEVDNNNSTSLEGQLLPSKNPAGAFNFTIAPQDSSSGVLPPADAGSNIEIIVNGSIAAQEDDTCGTPASTTTTTAPFDWGAAIRTTWHAATCADPVFRASVSLAADAPGPIKVEVDHMTTTSGAPAPTTLGPGQSVSLVLAVQPGDRGDVGGGVQAPDGTDVDIGSLAGVLLPADCGTSTPVIATTAKTGTTTTTADPSSGVLALTGAAVGPELLLVLGLLLTGWWVLCVARPIGRHSRR